jgi:WhiB family redox-sensing transcriptional regulator
MSELHPPAESRTILPNAPGNYTHDFIALNGLRRGQPKREANDYRRQEIIGLQNDDFPDWRNEAACKGSSQDIFFPEPKNPKQAKLICQQCPVIFECLEYALAANEEHGVWGGTTSTERKTITNRTKRLVKRLESQAE